MDSQQKNGVFPFSVRGMALLYAALWFLYGSSLFAADPADGSCPLLNHRYTASLVSDNLTGEAGEPINVSFQLNPPQPPAGFFLSVNMKPVQGRASGKAAKPQILTGFPDTTAVFFNPGTYRYRVVVSLIAKSSCGGLKADTVYDNEIRIQVVP